MHGYHCLLGILSGIFYLIRFWFSSINMKYLFSIRHMEDNRHYTQKRLLMSLLVLQKV